MADSEESSASEDEETLMFFLLLRRRRLTTSNRHLWSRGWLLKRKRHGVCDTLLRELDAEDPERFRQFHRLDRESFNAILEMISPCITRQETAMRSSISPRQRLSVTLRYLATGETFRSLSFQFRIGERTISGIVEDTCQALYATMKDTYLKTPASKEEWLKIADDFKRKWNYPMCIGAIDGKHIAIQQPPDTGSVYFNYKHFFSVLLLGIVDASYKFIYVDVGAPGRAGDAGVFNDSSFLRALNENTLDIPQPDNIDGIPINYHIIGDDAFAMSMKMMKPYPHRNLDRSKRIFNYRLSRARRVVENAFGILANRFRVFLTTINLGPDKINDIILAACTLHNYMVEKNKHSYTSGCDTEDTENLAFSAGSWRNGPTLASLSNDMSRNPPRNAKSQREQLTTYFSSESGSVPWQDKMINL